MRPRRTFVDCARHDFLARAGGPEPHLTGTVTHVRRIDIAVRVYVATPDHGEVTAEVPLHEFTALGLSRGDAVVAHVRNARVFATPLESV